MLDFTERRPRLWPNLDPNYYRVHGIGETSGVTAQRARFDRMLARMSGPMAMASTTD